MLAWARGETSAFDELYARHEGALYRFVRRLLGLRLAAEADELFKDAWLRIAAARDGFSAQGASWRSWAFTMTHHLAMDRLSLSGRQVAFYAHDEDGDGFEAAQLFSRGMLHEGASADEQAQASEEERAFWQAAGRRLLACLDELPDAQRAAFLLHHEDGFTAEALAQALDCSVETVHGRLRQALKKLRGCMERYLSVLDLGGPGERGSADDLRDADLQRALAHAPDHSAVPDWRVRKEILAKAHETVRPASAPVGKGSRRPWKAVLGAVSVAVLAAVLWPREPRPGFRPSVETAPGAPAAEVVAAASPPSPSLLSELLQPLRSVPEAPPEPAPERAAEPAPPPVPPLAPHVRKEEQASTAPRTADVLRVPVPMPLPLPPPLPLPLPLPQPQPQPSVTSAAPGTVRPATPASVRTDETEPPTFEPLSRWTRLTISRRGGDSRSLARADARELNALLGSAALSAVGPRPLAAAPEWRVALERNGETLAVFEIAGAQVRWREGKAPPATGVPSAPALAALRDALREAQQQPDQPSAAAPASTDHRP